jgi:hypothetical protein
VSYVLPEAPVPVTPWNRLTVALALVCARTLSRRPPASMRAVLGTLAAGARPATYDEAKLARDQVLTISARCRGGSACLVRSICVALLCRARGTWPTWCVGVTVAPPFAAHAWIEADGRVVDEPMSSSCYRSFFTVAAERRPLTVPKGERR